MCVDHLKRCKTSIFRCHFTCLLGFSSLPCFWLFVTIILNVQQGAVTEFVGSLPTKTPTFSGDALGDVLMCTCSNQFELLTTLSFSVFPMFSACTVFAIWFSTDIVRWNSCIELHQNSQNFRQGRRKKTSLRFSDLKSSKHGCQFLLSCLCTWDAYHISNSIRYFWASVCVCVCKKSSVCV